MKQNNNKNILRIKPDINQQQDKTMFSKQINTWKVQSTSKQALAMKLKFLLCKLSKVHYDDVQGIILFIHTKNSVIL